MKRLYAIILLVMILAVLFSSCAQKSDTENIRDSAPSISAGEKDNELVSTDGAENESTDKPDQTDKNNTNSDNNTSGGNATPDKSVSSKPDSTSTVTAKSTTKPSINVTDKANPTEKPTTKPDTNKPDTNTEKPTVIPPTPPVVIVPSGVSLNKSALTLDIGDIFTLTETVIPNNSSNKTVTWNSSKNSVAIVDSKGKVTAKGKGTATITVTTHNGKTAQCVVTVNAPKPKSPFDRPFDVAKMVESLKNYGESMGMTWSEPLNPDNCSWDAPGTTHGLSGDDLRNTIEAGIRRVKKSQQMNGYQPGEFHFKVLFVPLTNGEYQIYFLRG